MRKVFLMCLLCLSVLSAGCANGEITLEISRMGTADITCKLMTMPFLQQALVSFRKDFSNDGFDIREVNENSMSGFIAHKSYLNVGQIKDAKVLKAFRFENSKEVQPANGGKAETDSKFGNAKANSNVSAHQTTKTAQARKPLVTFDSGLLFDTVILDTRLNLDPNVASGKEQEQWILQNIMRQVDLRFVLKLPTYTESNNATRVEENGKKLTWVLPLGVDTPLKAKAVFLNPYKAAGWVSAVVIILIAVVVFFSYKKRKMRL